RECTPSIAPPEPLSSLLGRYSAPLAMPTLAVQQVVGYLAYTGCDANVSGRQPCKGFGRSPRRRSRAPATRLNLPFGRNNIVSCFAGRRKAMQLRLPLAFRRGRAACPDR